MGGEGCEICGMVFENHAISPATVPIKFSLVGSMAVSLAKMTADADVGRYQTMLAASIELQTFSPVAGGGKRLRA